MSQISAAPLRTTYWVFQIGSKLARSACGTKRSVRAAARWEIAGVASPPAASAAVAFRNALRSMTPSYKPVGRNKPPGPAFGRPDDKLRALRRFTANTLAECHVETSPASVTGTAQCATLIAPYGPPAQIMPTKRFAGF